MEGVELDIAFDVLRALNLILATGLVMLVSIGFVVMRRRVVLGRSGKYALIGILLVFIAKWLSSYAYFLRGEHPAISGIIFFLQTFGFILIATHVAFGLRHRKDV